MGIFKQNNPFHPFFGKYMVENDIQKNGIEALKPENVPPIKAFNTQEEAEILLKKRNITKGGLR